MSCGKVMLITNSKLFSSLVGTCQMPLHSFAPIPQFNILRSNKARALYDINF